jgi:hypothetical protein
MSRVLGRPEVGSKISKLTQKIVDSNRDVVRTAMEAFVAQEALARFGYAPKDVVRASPERVEPAAVPVPVESPVEELSPSTGEMQIFNYARNRLFYLVRNDVLFQEVENINFKKTKTSFRAYYTKPNSVSLFDYREHKDGRKMLQFPALGGEEIEYVFSADLDDRLLKAFTMRVAAAGVSFESSPVLRTIKGGQAGKSTL